jgi:hypothetical protein
LLSTALDRYAPFNETFPCLEFAAQAGRRQGTPRLSGTGTLQVLGATRAIRCIISKTHAYFFAPPRTCPCGTRVFRGRSRGLAPMARSGQRRHGTRRRASALERYRTHKVESGDSRTRTFLARHLGRSYIHYDSGSYRRGSNRPASPYSCWTRRTRNP